MGLLDSIFDFYLPNIPAAPVMTSALPPAAVSLIQQGTLPTLNVDTLVLKKSEICHYVDMSCMVTQKVERHYQRRNHGSSFKIAKGWYSHVGGGYSRPIEFDVPVYTKGYLYITNQRIVFVSHEKGFDKKIDSLSAITSYADGVGLQFGEKIYNIMTPSAESASIVMHLLGK